MKTWLEPSALTIPPDFYTAIGGHPIVAESLWRRAIQTAQEADGFLNPARYQPSNVDAFTDIDKTIERLKRAIKRQETILVWGDFDVDGQTSTALLVSALRQKGATVRYHVPNRFTEGHGIFLPTFQKLLAEPIGLVLTCDTGIAAHDALDYAHERGIDVIITDHHALPPHLPKAYATLNPMLLEEGHPLRELSGVGVAYKVIEALYENQDTEQFLDLVALGLMADVMVQVDDTRYLLQRGLEVLRTRPRLALQMMLERAGIQAANLTEMDIAFGLAPRLNAIGRLDDARRAVELLLSTNPVYLAEAINELEGLNQQRKFLTRQVHAAAQEQIKQAPDLLKYAVLVLSQAEWHTGVLGIVASRLVDEYQVPVILLSEHEGIARGSARSIAGCNIVEAMRTQTPLLLGYGGHNMAAGLSLPSEKVFELRRNLSQVVRESLRETVSPQTLAIDAYLPLSALNLELAEDVSRLAPFGNGNPPLALASRDVKLTSRRTLGSRGEHLELQVEDSTGAKGRVIWWFGDIEALPIGRFDIAYTLRPNTFNGKREALLEWLGARPLDDASYTVQQPRYEVLDYRHSLQADNDLRESLGRYPAACLWSEGLKSINGKTRYELESAETLIVWTVPPSLADWRAALQVVQPQRLILFGNQAPFPDVTSLLRQLAGLAKYAIQQKRGLITLQDLVKQTGQTEHLLKLACRYLSQTSELQFELLTEDLFDVRLQAKAPKISSALVQVLEASFRETRAYRQYWLNQSM